MGLVVVDSAPAALHASVYPVYVPRKTTCQCLIMQDILIKLGLSVDLIQKENSKFLQ